MWGVEGLAGDLFSGRPESSHITTRFFIFAFIDGVFRVFQVWTTRGSRVVTEQNCVNEFRENPLSLFCVKIRGRWASEFTAPAEG